MFPLRLGFLGLWLVLLLGDHESVAQGQPTDHQIRESIQRELAGDYRLRVAGIQVRSVGGNVTLEGTVESYLDKRRAERICNQQSGVRKVANRIDIAPIPRLSEDIVETVMRRLDEESLLRGQRIQVYRDGPTILLTGVVGNSVQAMHAERLARQVRGVNQLRNELTYSRADPHTSDASGLGISEMLSTIRKSFDRDAVLADLPIEIKVRDGKITLVGVVDNLQQRSYAARKVRLLTSNQRVDNQLRVGEMDPADRSSEPRKEDLDSQVAHHVKLELESDPAIDSAKVSVVCSGGFVMLRGSVPSMHQKSRSFHVAQRTNGVRWVTSELVVDEDPRDDREIQRGIEQSLRSDIEMDPSTIQVAVEKSMVMLTGTVNNLAAGRRAKRLAQRVRGVLSVKNDLLVETDRPQQDEDILATLYALFESDVALNPCREQIKVVVTDGHVRLDGKVEHWKQRRRAYQIIESVDGVRSLKNDLTIAGAFMADGKPQ